MTKQSNQKVEHREAGIERVTIKGHDFVIIHSGDGKRTTKTAQEYELLEKET